MEKTNNREKEKEKKMPEGAISEGSAQLKQLRHARSQTLKEWDISFGINGEVLNNIFGFISDINTDALFKFYEDRIFIHQKSPDNVQYAELNISSSDVLDYNANLIVEKDEIEEKVEIEEKANETGEAGLRAPDRAKRESVKKGTKSIIKSQGGDYKPVLLDLKGTSDEISSFSQKDDLIVVRIDTVYYKRIEFHCPGNIVIWSQLVDPATILKTLESLPGRIERVRKDPNIKKASAIIEPATLNKILDMGGKGGKKRDIDERIYIELDKQEGLYITSGDKLKGRYFEIRPTEIGVDQIGTDSGAIYEDDFNLAETEEMDDFGFAPRGDKKNIERKRPENKTIDQLLEFDVDSTQYVYLSKEFMIPFTKLKGLSPIVIEVRTDKPIVLEQKPYNGITALLTIAPRIESEDDK